MAPLYSRLTKEEISRNKHGPCLLYTYDPSLSFVCHSSLPGKFPDISCCHARFEHNFFYFWGHFDPYEEALHQRNDQ